MRFDQLPLGAVVTLGSKLYRPWDGNSPRMPLKWYKVGPDKLLAYTSLFSDLPRSAEENGVSNFYPRSHVHQILQGLDKFFTPEELNVLQPFTIHVDVPKPLRRVYGKTYQCDVFAALPALSELIDLDHVGYVPGGLEKEEETFFPGNNRPENLYYISQLTRTASGSKSYRYAYAHNQFENHKSSRHTAIKPVISILGTTEFMYDGESYVLIDQDLMLDEDLLSCLL